MILLIPPTPINVGQEIRQIMERNGFTQYEEIEPKAGCRRFRLT